MTHHHIRPTTLVRCSLEINPQNAVSWSNLAGALPEGGKANVDGIEYDALACITRSLEINPQNAVSWSNLGGALPEGGKANVDGIEYDALACITRSLELNPKGFYSTHRLLTQVE